MYVGSPSCMQSHYHVLADHPMSFANVKQWCFYYPALHTLGEPGRQAGSSREKLLEWNGLFPVSVPNVSRFCNEHPVTLCTVMTDGLLPAWAVEAFVGH
jgi:hypothetical protein